MTSFVAEVRRGAGPVRATGIANPAGSSWIVGDIRLDGRDALRDTLGAAGVPTPRDASDAALAMLAWGAWRETATERLRGDFSFAIWDARDRVLFCARDPLGVRPLYWADIGGTFVCSNHLDAVRAHAAVSSQLHEPAIVAFLRFGYNDDLTTTSFRDVRRLAPAHSLTVRDAQSEISPRRYWNFPVPEPLRLASDEEYLERFRDVMNAAVRDRVRGNRVGIMMSGGLDSTTLAATARNAVPGVALRAWTLDDGGSVAADEVRLAASVAARLDVVHEIVRYQGVPFAHLAVPGFRTPEPLDEPDWGPWERVLQSVSRDAPTLIIGEDGDSLFRPPGLITMLRAWPAHDVVRRVLAYISSHRRKPHLGLWLRRRLAAPFKRDPGYDPRWLRREFVDRDRSRAPASAEVHATRPEAVSYLGDPYWQRYLEAAQPAYTGVPLETVWPLLDTRLIEFVFSIPPLPWCQDKELMRVAFRNELPDAVITRPKSPARGRFERQVAEWRASVGGGTVALSDGVCRFVDTSSALDTLRSGRATDVGVAWRVLVLDQWLRQLDRPRGES